MKYAEVPSSIKEQLLFILMEVQHALHHPSLKLRIAGCLGLVLVSAISITAATPLEPATVTQPLKKDPLFVETLESGIREMIPQRYGKRYQNWKEEFLSTEIGRNQWERYAHNTRFLLTITVSRENQNGAATANYVWDESDALVAATITLGCRIDQGYPELGSYPVLNSLRLFETWYVKSSPRILAAAKIAHEFGHLNNTAHTNGALFRLQNHLIPEYIRILKSTGWNTHDPRLLELSKQMGGTSLQIWSHREFEGEANAMLYLRDKITEGILPCRLFTRIKRNVEFLEASYLGALFISPLRDQPQLFASRQNVSHRWPSDEIHRTLRGLPIKLMSHQVRLEEILYEKPKKPYRRTNPDPDLFNQWDCPALWNACNTAINFELALVGARSNDAT